MFHVGVVEDRLDPFEIGRCRVRVFGVHTEDKNELPTSDLPWSMPMQPINNAATSGIGMSPNGIVQGAWVVGFFLDGEDKQQFMMMGTISAIQAANIIGEAAVQRITTSQPTTPKTFLTDSFGNVVTDGTGHPILAGSVDDEPPVVNTTSGTVDPSTVRKPKGWTLGQTSKKYESGSRGCGAINKYQNSGDLGGASYGTYQFASYLPVVMPNGKSRPNAAKSPLVAYLSASKFADKFINAKPATPEFDAAWTNCAKNNTAEFEADQHEFIKTKYYDVMIGNLKRAGLDLSPFGAGVQDLVWSTAVQMGPARTSIFLTPLKGKTQLDDVTIITLVSDYKIENVDTLFKSSSQNIKDGVRARYKSEKADLLKLASNYNSKVTTATSPDEKKTTIPPKASTEVYTPKADPHNQDVLVATSIGFCDPDGIYPTKDYANLPDTNKLARGITKGTAAEEKTLNRATGIRLAHEETFDQPLNPYNAKYPYNKVFETESGHVVEYDDTPGAERINIYHTSGTFTEIDANGNMTRRVMGSDYQITDGNGYVRVEGRCNISVGGSATVVVASDAYIEVDGNTHITCGNDIVAEAAGRIQVSAGEGLDLRSKNIYIEADEELHMTAGTKINAQSDGKFNLKSGSDMNLQSDGNMNAKSAGDAILDGSGSTNLRSSGNVNIDGSNLVMQTGTAKSAGESEEADYSESGILEGRIEYDEVLIEDEFPAPKVDGEALKVETPEEVADGGAEQLHKEMLESGSVTKSELDVKAVPLTEPEKPVPMIVSKPVPESDQAAYIRTLTSIPVTYRLTPNFTLDMLSVNAPAQRDRVRAQCNLTEGQIVANLYELAVNVLEPIKKAYPNMFVTSAFRDFGHNTVKGISQHCLGLAADMQFRGVPKSDYYGLAQELRRLLPMYDQLLLEYKTTGSGNPWIHVSYNSKSNRNQVMTFFNNRPHSQGLIQLA